MSRSPRPLASLLWLSLAIAPLARGAEDRPQAPIEVYEWSIWVGSPAQTSLNAPKVYRNAMPGAVGTSRPKAEEPELSRKFPVAPISVVQAFGEPAFAVDTHIHRLAERWRLSNGKSVEQTERDLKKVFPRDEWSRRHLQIIYFGREHCPARGHDVATCPICSWASRRSPSSK